MSIHDEDVKPLIVEVRRRPSLYYNQRLVIYPFIVSAEPPKHFEGSVISLMSTLQKKHTRDTYCPDKGCWRVNLAKHVQILNDLLANTTREGCLQYLVGCCKLGHDIHAQIPQIEDILPNFPRGCLEIPFEREEREPVDKRGVPLLEILFNWKNIRDHDKLPERFLALTKTGFLLRFMTRHQELGPQSYGVKFKCDNHTLSWSDVAINIVYGIIEDLEKGNPPIVFDFNRRAFPIPSILHARLVSLVSEDGKVWWPKFSTALIEPTSGQYTPCIQYA